MPPQTKLKSSTPPPSEKAPTPPAENQESKPVLVTPGKIPAELSQQLRKLAHDLSNSMETVMQASYLLAQANLDETNRKWLSLIDQASRDAARINREIREILRSNSE
jgi:hypothetical protein